jgi:hypothetical protein
MTNGPYCATGTNRPALQQENVCGTVDGLYLDRLIGLHLHGRCTDHESTGNAQ